MDSTSTTFENRVEGCIIGAICGDAVGAFLEFSSSVTDWEVNRALTLPGGGPHQLGEGQITDDSELLLCLGQALAESGKVLDLDKIAEYYGKWIQSRPFDIGTTTRRSLPKAVGANSNQAQLVRQAAQHSMKSQSNGGLMRVAPLCIWCVNLGRDDLIKAVTEEIKLSHPNEITVSANIVYAYTIQHLLKNAGDYEGAYMKCKEMVEYLKNEEMSKWLEDIENERLPIATENMGRVKIGFCHAIYFMKKNTDYLDAMKMMLAKAGDTDTNCCIVGGMLGALHGFGKLPEDIVKKVLAFDPEKSRGLMRPSFLVPGKQVGGIIKTILANLPEKLEMKGAETK